MDPIPFFSSSASLASGNPSMPPMDSEILNSKRKLLENLKKRINALMEEGSLDLYKPEGLQLQVKYLGLELEITTADFAQRQITASPTNAELQEKYTAEVSANFALKAQLEETQKKLVTTESENKELQSAKRKLEDNVKVLASQKEEWLIQETRYRKRIETIQQEAGLRPTSTASGSDEREQVAKKHKKELEQQAKLIADQKTTIESLEKEKAAYEAQSLEFNHGLEGFEALITTNENKIAELAKLNAQYKEKLVSTESLLTNTRETLQITQANYEQEAQKAQKLEDQVKTLQGSIKKFEEDSAKYTSENTELRLKLEGMKADLKSQEEKLSAFGELSRKFGSLISAPTS